MKPLLVLYHANCLDGVAAAWAVRNFNANCELVPVSYSDTPPDVTGRDVDIVDFSYKRDVLLEMKAKANSLLVLDHHKSAQEELEGLDFCIFDMERSGCVIAWDYYGWDIPTPRLLSIIQDRDLWRFAYPETKAVTAALFSYELTPDLIEEKSHSLPELASEGEALIRQSNSSVSRMIKTSLQWWSIAGYRVPVINTNMYHSEIGSILAQDHPFAATYHDTPNGRSFSLRSVGRFDVSEIAKSFGGGGHRNAAGFIIPYDYADNIRRLIEDD